MSIEMTVPDLLQQDLTTYPSASTLQCAILNAFFDCHLSTADFALPGNLWTSYFDYYHDQCLMAISHGGGLARLVRNHHDIVRIVKLLRDPENTRESIKETIKDIERERKMNWDLEISDEVTFNAIDLAARLSLMILVGDFRQVLHGGERTLVWREGQLLASLAADFCRTGLLEMDHVKLEKLFNGRSLERIAGIQIIWTSNLADHLRMQNDDRAVSIFHHASFLKSQQESEIYPPGFIDETLSTLALLLPQYDNASNIWFERQSQKESLDANATKCGHPSAEGRQIGNFHYWRDRLVILKQVFDEAEPRGIKQWWRDRRKPVQWYNFWLAVALIAGLTFFFGLVQSIEGGIQVWKAYHPS